MRLSKKEEDLFNACYGNAVAKMEELLNEGEDVDLVRDDVGDTLLMTAIRVYNIQMIKFLLEYGANVNMSNRNGETALSMACEWKGNYEVVKELIDSGAGVNNIDIFGKTPLMHACKANDVDNVKVLLEYGAGTDLENCKGQTALDYACRFSDIDIVKVLLEYGAKIDEKDCVGYTALDYACRRENIEIARELIDRGASLNNISRENMKFIIEFVRSNNEKDLIYACEIGDVATVEKLLNEGKNVDLICNDDCDTLLMTAVKHNKELVAKALLEHGANVNARNNEGDTALMLACLEDEKYNDAVVKMLLNNGADINAKNNKGETALSIACRCEDNYEVIKELIDKGADVKNIDNRGMTPLLIACEYNKDANVKALLEYGAEIDGEDDVFGLAELHYACENENIEMARELIDCGASLNKIPEESMEMEFITEKLSDCIKGMKVKSPNNEKDLIHACIRGDVATVGKLLNEEENVNLKCKGTGDTLLIKAVRYNKGLVVDTLLKHGADINAQNNEGDTALIMACKMSLDKDNDEIVKMLLNNRADVNMKNKEGETALSIASRGNGTNNYEIVKELLNNGAVDVNNIDDDGKTLLIIACESDDIEMVKVLLEYGAEIDEKDNVFGKTALDYACENENIEMTRELIKSGASLKNISEESMQFITEKLSDSTEVKILTAISNRDSENIGSYLGEYFNKINKDTSVNKISVPEYMKDVSKFYQLNNYITNLKYSKEVKELREETRLLKEKIEKINKVRFTSEKLDEIKQKVHRNKMILKELKTFEMKTKDMLNVKKLEPIYCKKQSISFEIK